MKQHITVFLICIAHVVLATLGYVSLYISIPLSVLVALYAALRLTLQPDWSVMIHVSLFIAYILNDSIVQNMLLLVGATVLLLYSAKSQQAIFRASTRQLEVKDQLQQFNDTFQEVRKERHDYLKHVSAIAYLLEKEDIEEAKSYMKGILTRYEQTNLSIKGEKGAVASVLYSNYEKARSSNIAINYLLEVPVSNLPLASDEVVQLLGNILDNALEAAVEWQQAFSEQGFVELTLRKKSGLFLLTCTNSTIPLQNDIADRLFVQSGVTTKQHHSGLGTSIIQQIVEQHNGYLEFIAEKQTFTITCKIPNVVV